MRDTADERRADLHSNGVHVECGPPRNGQTDGSWRQCKHAGKVGRLHGHDYDGPLVCGCEEFL